MKKKKRKKNTEIKISRKTTGMLASFELRQGSARTLEFA